MSCAMTLMESSTGEVVFEGARVTRRTPCPVCGHDTWCLVDRMRGLSLCPRTESPRKIGQAGWMHSTGGAIPSATKFSRPESEIAPLEGAASMQARFLRQGSPRLGLLALMLGLSRESLEWLGAGWNGSAWTFPMHNHREEIVGFRTRTEEGAKLAIKGSRSGLFIPRSLSPDGDLWIVEGPTDCAALLDMGEAAIGRPSCRGCEREVDRWIRIRNFRTITVVADNDLPGIEGAEALIESIAAPGRKIRMALPPAGIKDARALLNSHGTSSDFVMRAVSAPRRNTNGRRP